MANWRKHREHVTAGGKKKDRSVTVSSREESRAEASGIILKKGKAQREGKPVPMEINKPLQLWGFWICGN